MFSFYRAYVRFEAYRYGNGDPQNPASYVVAASTLGQVSIALGISLVPHPRFASDNVEAI